MERYQNPCMLLRSGVSYPTQICSSRLVDQVEMDGAWITDTQGHPVILNSFEIVYGEVCLQKLRT